MGLRYILTSSLAPTETGPGSFYTFNVQHPEYHLVLPHPSQIQTQALPTHPRDTLLPHHHHFSLFHPPYLPTATSELDAQPTGATIPHATSCHRVPRSE